MIVKARTYRRNGGKLLVCPLAQQFVCKPVVFLGIVKLQKLKHIADIHLGIAVPAPVVESNKGLLDHIVLVPDLADKLLEDILNGDYAECAAVIVGDYRHIKPFLAHNGQQVVNICALVDKIRLVKQLAKLDVFALAQIRLYVLADRQYADNIVDASLVNGQAAVLLLADVGEDFLGGILNIHRRKVYP